MGCLGEVKDSENTGHLVEVIFGLTETLLEFDAEQDLADLHPLGVPVGAVRRRGYVRVSTCCLAIFRHIHASRLSDPIPPDFAQFTVNVTEYLRENGSSRRQPKAKRGIPTYIARNNQYLPQELLMNESQSIDQWYIRNLVCPIDYSNLEYSREVLICENDHKYPVEDGVPVMLLEDKPETIGVASDSIKRARGEKVDQRAPELYLESLAVGEEEKRDIVELAERENLNIDPVVANLIVATCGLAYKRKRGEINRYPIPNPPLPESDGSNLLDIGCSWGRWSIAAAQKGYNVIGIDPSLGAVMAGQRIANSFDLPIKFVVADARNLPLRRSTFQTVFSYSVLQHLSRQDAKKVLQQVKRVLEPGGVSLIQMATAFGLRNLQNQMKRRFRQPTGFEVRYWDPWKLQNTFEKIIGKTNMFVDSYFGLGLHEEDKDMMPPHISVLISLSTMMRRFSKSFELLKYIADSVYLRSVYGGSD